MKNALTGARSATPRRRSARRVSRCGSRTSSPRTRSSRTTSTSCRSGNNAFGVEVAAERYFNKTMFQLTLPESALLAGLVQAPTRARPDPHPAAARARRGRCSRRWSDPQDHRGGGRRREQSPLPTVSTRAVAAQLLHRRAARSAARTRLRGSRRSRERARPDRAAGRPPVPGRPADLHELRPPDAVPAQPRDRRTIPSNQSQFTAALVVDRQHQRRGACGRVRARLRREPVDPAVDGSGPAGRLVVQDHHARGRALERLFARRPCERRTRCSWQLGPGGSDPYYNLSGDCHGGDPTLTQAIAKSDNCAFVRTELSLGPGHYGRDGVRKVIDMASRMGIDTSNFQPVRLDHARHQRRAPARDGAGLLGDRRRRVLHPASSSRRSSGPTARCCTRTTGRERAS